MVLNRFFSLFLLIFVGIFWKASLDLPLTEYNGSLGVGFFPLIISTILSILTICYAVKVFVRKYDGVKTEDKEEKNKRSIFQNQLVFVFFLIVCLALTEVIGMLISLGLFVLVSLWFIEKMSFYRSIMFSAILMLSIYVVFEKCLGIVLPIGLFS
ncbi:tripartite tricarboxylate transporter TctB family protein [Brevibacillus sp. H7]|uniref:tripartite tricarboxylate transporter TctB family protein n=1 Tax=Brevibacillus sp. H7 TaxID=3349138 RepID=UPI00382DF166